MRDTRGRTVGELVYSEERGCWVEASPAPRAARGGRRGGADRSWSDEERLVMLFVALRRGEKGLRSRVMAALELTGAQYWCARSNALDALGLPGGYKGDGAGFGRLVKTLGADECGRRGMTVLEQLSAAPVQTEEA